MWSAGVQRQLPWKIVLDVTYVGRRGVFLQRERNVNQLQAGTLQANPGVNIAALRPYKGYGALRVTENTGSSDYNSLQISGERRYSNGFKLGVAYTYGKSYDNGSDKRNVLWNTYDDSIFWGPSSFDRTHVLVVSYIYDLPFWRDQSTLLRNLLGGWQISGATFIQSGTPFSITRTNDIAGVGEGSNGQPVDLVGDPNANANGQFSAGNGLDTNFWFNPAAFANPAAGKFGNSTRNILRNPGAQQWDIALFKNFVLGGTHRLQFRAEVFNFINHPNLSGPNGDITNPNFGRVITKDGSRRDIQLALRYLLLDPEFDGARGRPWPERGRRQPPGLCHPPPRRGQLAPAGAFRCRHEVRHAMRLRAIVWLVPLMAVGSGAWVYGQKPAAADTPVPSMRVLRTDDFAIDGKGSAPAWSRAEWQSLSPRAGGDSPHPTRFKMTLLPHRAVRADGRRRPRAIGRDAGGLPRLVDGGRLRVLPLARRKTSGLFRVRDLAARLRAAHPRAQLRRPVLRLAPVALRRPAEDPEGGERPRRPGDDRRSNHGLDG